MTNMLRHLLGVQPNTKRRILTPIVPSGGVTSLALTVVVAIMTFLSCLAIGGVYLINQSAVSWEGQVSSEATIQILPIDGQNMEENLAKAAQVAKGISGVVDARIVDEAATKRLLEPWFGSDVLMDDLPLPRLIIVTLGERGEVNFDGLKTAIEQIPGGIFNDHSTWMDRLISMAYTSVLIGIVILALVLIALALTIIFATRSALASNSSIIEVLHFIGAENKFIARQFDWHFFRTGFRGALYGGIAAIVTFFILSLWVARNMADPNADQAMALFSGFSIGWQCYLEMAILVIFVSCLTMMTSRVTIIRQLNAINGTKNKSF